MTQGSKHLDLDFADQVREILDASALAQCSLSPLAALALGAAHELSSPLSTIAVAASELEHECTYREGGLTSLSDVRLIRDQVQRCRAVLIQMVADATALGGEPWQDIVVDELLAQLRRELDGRGRLRLAIDPPVSSRIVRVPVRAALLALRNVVTNGWQAMPPGGEVVIRGATKDGRLAIAIEDSGSGMTPEVMSRATEALFTTKRSGANLGLGLFLTRLVLERIGGALSLASTPGRGTHIVVELPAA